MKRKSVVRMCIDKQKQQKKWEKKIILQKIAAYEK